MTTPFVCLGLATVLAYAPKLFGLVRRDADTQTKIDRITHDGFQALIAFAIAVSVAHYAGADGRRATIISIAFVVTRALYLGSHPADLEFLRAALWGLGLVLTGFLFCLPWMT